MLFIVLLIAIVIVIFAYFHYTFVTKTGQEHSIKRAMGADTVEKLGELPKTIYPGYGHQLTQTLRVYKCSHPSEGVFYVLDSTFKTFGGFTRYYTKLTPEMMDSLFSYYKQSNSF